MDPLTWFAIHLARAMRDFVPEPCYVLFLILPEYPFLTLLLIPFFYFSYRGIKCLLKHRKKLHDESLG